MNGYGSLEKLFRSWRERSMLGRVILMVVGSAIAATACSPHSSIQDSSIQDSEIVETAPAETTETTANIETINSTDTFDVSDCQFYTQYALGGTEEIDSPPSTLSVTQGKVSLSQVMWEGAPCVQTSEALYSPDGSQIATGSVDGVVRLWDTTGNQLVSLSPFDGPTWRISKLWYSPDGSQLAIAGGRYHALTLWNLGERIGENSEGDLEAVNTIDFPNTNGGSINVEYSPNSRLLAIFGLDDVVSLWNLAGDRIAPLTYPSQPISLAVDFNPTSDRIIADGRDGTVRLWDTTGNQLAVLRGHKGNFEQITYSPDGRQILTLMGDNVARLWDAQGNSQGTLSNYSQKIVQLVYSPNSQKIVTGAHKGEAVLWNSLGHKLAVLEGHSQIVSHVMFSPDGQQIATASPEESIVRLWDTKGNLSAEIEAHTGGVTKMQYSPNAQMIATGGRDNAVRLWDRAGNPLAAIESTSEEDSLVPFTTLSFSPQSDQLLVIGPLNDAVYLWNVDSHR
ncbi:WD40 repeat domain-containing protein [cf. Phormidesmis sp. LEGE 11477]|uniref:WD40 repeat domain-containing protein n=1 Tax=cf. Phormidesmis sp. LEGE 11477 TaxID=1828680 RepID=UPI00187F1535|nr:WD40 repeat domain-containing protein [cf. Phormidesmis sp. LEGE 11477]MBE9062118.1 hypothetical protein [cf. Phormidesmis sp. LEGE 11477]